MLRKVVRRVGQGTLPPIRVAPDDVRSYLGSPLFQDEVAEHVDRPGVVTGLAWMPSGGDILFVEATITPGDEDRLVLTGMLGDVMRESAQAALSYLRSNGARLRHRPSRAPPQDRPHPRAGGRHPQGRTERRGHDPGRARVAGARAPGAVRPGDDRRVTLRGRVLPVGGIKEKVLAAHRAGMRMVILPARCEAQLEDVPEDVLRALQLVFVESADEVLAIALDRGLPERATPPVREPAASVQ